MFNIWKVTHKTIYLISFFLYYSHHFMYISIRGSVQYSWKVCSTPRMTRTAGGWAALKPVSCSIKVNPGQDVHGFFSLYFPFGIPTRSSHWYYPHALLKLHLIMIYCVGHHLPERHIYADGSKEYVCGIKLVLRGVMFWIRRRETWYLTHKINIRRNKYFCLEKAFPKRWSSVNF